MRSHKTIPLLAAGLLTLGSIAWGNPIPVPPVYETLNYQGNLWDTVTSNPVNGEFPLTVRLYDSDSGGTLLFQEEFPSVTVTGGVFQVVLGLCDPLPDDVTSAQELWVETVFNGTTLPRQLLGTVPRALHANNATYAHGAAFDFITYPVWRTIGEDNTITLTHNLGGDPSYYIVILEGKASDGSIHQANLGTNQLNFTLNRWIGCEWFGLTSTQIKVQRANYDAVTAPSKDWKYFRVRIIRNQPRGEIPSPMPCVQ